MDELTKYIFDNYFALLTFEEQAAYKSILGVRKIENADSPEMKRMLRKSWVSTDPKVTALLENGVAAFMKNARDRVLREHIGKVFLNNCPRCGELTKTPRAKQCPKCFFSWHDDV